MSRDKPNYTTILVSHETVARLKDMGKKGETYNDILVRLLDRVQRKR